MLSAALPENENERLAALEALGLMYTPAEERFDRITRLTKRLFGVPIVLVTLVAETCQWFKSAVGLETPETSRAVSFCAHAILSDDTFIVEDAIHDPRFCDNPLVTGSPNIRFYAGHPIRAEDGSRVGSLCVIDTVPRTFGESDCEALRDLAMLVEAELHREYLGDSQRKLVEQRDAYQRKASIDGLTRLWNRDAILELLEMEIARAVLGRPLCLALIDVDLFKAVNDDHGHQAGDRVLAEVAQCIRTSLRDVDAVGRYGGDEFVVIFNNCRIEAAQESCERIRRAVERTKIATAVDSFALTVSIGLVAYSSAIETAVQFLEIADRALYQAKDAGRNQTTEGQA